MTRNQGYIIKEVFFLNHSLSLDEERLFQFFQERFDTYYDLNKVKVTEYEKTIEQLRTKSDDEKNSIFDDLIGEYGQVVSHTIIQTFGLGPFFHEDKDGGKVTTIHNAQKGIYARKEDEFSRNKYGYDASKKIVLQTNEKRGNKHIDAYTGKTIDRVNVDHVVPLDSFHKNGGFLLDDSRKKLFSSDIRNLVVTDETLNKSKGALQLNDFRMRKNDGQENVNDVRFSIDKERAEKISKKANIAYDEHQISKSEKIKVYSSRNLQAGLDDGFRLGTREAIGFILNTLTIELFKEIKLYAKNFKHYRTEGVLWAELNKMSERVIENTRVQLKELLKATAKVFGEGVVSGLISSILTTVINMFITTKKRIVRIVREGFLSIFRAFKLLFSNPDNLSKSMLYREVTKLFITGLVVAGGIAFEEVIENALKGMALPFVPLISSTLVGILTGIVLATIIYMIDQVWIELPSTKELIASSNELIEKRKLLQSQFDSIVLDLSVSQSGNTLNRLNNTNRTVEDTIDFFEE